MYLTRRSHYHWLQPTTISKTEVDRDNLLLASVSKINGRLNMEYEIESTMDQEVNEGIGPAPDIYERNFVDLEDAVTNFKKSSRFLVDAVDIPDDKGEEIAVGIRNRTAKAVSDGSFLPEHKAGAA